MNVRSRLPGCMNALHAFGEQASERTSGRVRAYVRACICKIYGVRISALRRNGHGEDDAIVNGDSPSYNSEISILREHGNRSSLQHGGVNSLFAVADVCVVPRFRR